MRTLRYLFPLLALMLVSESELRLLGADFAVDEVVALVSAATTAIESVECRYQVFHAEVIISPSDTLDEKTGWGLGWEYDWAWERSTGREALRGMWSAPNDDAGTMNRYHWSYAYNGRVLKTFSHDNNGGEVAPVQTLFTRKVSPLICFGRDVGFIPTVRSLPELLHGAELLESTDASSDVLVLRSEFEDGNGEDKRHKLTVWVDPAKGFSPRRIEIRERRTRQVIREYDVEDAKEVAPGVWFPMRATSTYYYYADIIEPESVKELDVEKMSTEEKAEFFCNSVQVRYEAAGIRHRIICNAARDDSRKSSNCG